MVRRGGSRSAQQGVFSQPGDCFGLGFDTGEKITRLTQPRALVMTYAKHKERQPVSQVAAFMFQAGLSVTLFRGKLYNYGQYIESSWRQLWARPKKV
jgi:hypothetical protein